MQLEAPQISEEKIDVIEKILANMAANVGGVGKAGILLHGDPGVGKTSFVRQLAKLVGMNLIVIETPHITEEHIISIPFIVYDPITDGTSSGTTEFDPNSFEVVLSNSALLGKLLKANPIEESKYLAALYAGDKQLIKVFEELGGTKDSVPSIIKKVRASKQTILFLDEYFRQTSNRIKNMLRGILNGKIGTADLPRDVYVIYASNMNDEGVDEIPLNADFRSIEFTSPEKDDWFSYLVSKFDKDTNVKLNKQVLESFYKLLTRDDLNHSDISKDVRVSPRRWEQVLLYLNASLPVDNEQDAKALLANIKLQFKNYLTGEHSELYQKVMKEVAELIKTTSKISVGHDEGLDTEDWREVLKHQLKTKQKLGKARSYIPVVSGLPGIGKTSEMLRAATELNLRYIPIDASTLDPEDVIGIPLAEKDGKHINTRFSSPKLFKQITDDIKEADKDYITHLKATLKGDDLKKALDSYDKQPYKYLVFFDELNRTSTKVFNGLRRVLLDKSFSDSEALPPESVVVAAINPEDVGAGQLTSHVRDVVDVIDAAPNWSSTIKFLQDMPIDGTEEGKKAAMDIILGLVDKFKTPGKGGQFRLNVGDNPAYISPREYADLYSNTVHDFDIKIERLKKKINSDDEGAAEAAINALKDGIFKSIKSTFQTVLIKQGLDNPGFYEDVRTWIDHNLDIGEGVIFKKGKISGGFKEIADRHVDKLSEGSIAEDQDIINYLLNVSIQTFKEDVQAYLLDKIKDVKGMEDFLTNSQKKMRVVQDGVPALSNDLENEGEGITKLENFMRDVLNAIQIHEIPGDKREALRQAFLSITKEESGMKKLISDVAPSGSPYYENLIMTVFRVHKHGNKKAKK